VEERTTDRIGECRQCPSWCDKLIEPRGCVEMGCRFLYSHVDELTGRSYMGCLNKVFRVEIDIDLFREIERTRPGYGGVKMTGRPLPQCPFVVEPCFEAEARDHECVNPRFFDCTEDGPRGLRVFDLRNALA
jgi:hypothetical protein